jgi:3-phosphoshikimate 1-carboxyvinyltransferase
MTLHFTADSIRAGIHLPASKSISNRALILNALAYSSHDIQNLSDCDDTRVMIRALDSNDSCFDVGAAGTSMRFLTAFLAKTVGEWCITGSERMKQRPIRLLVDALNSLGAKIEYLEQEGFPPLKIYGSAMMGGKITLNGGVSSQYISALMMIAPYMVDGLVIQLEGNVISVPYIEMTRSMMAEFGVQTSFENNTITIEPQQYTPVPFTVESDWSAASYWYELLSITGKGEVFLYGLKQNSYQGDARVAQLFEQLGVTTSFEPEGVRLTPTNSYTRHFSYNFINEPDLAQTFAVTCCIKGIPFEFSGLQSLKIKETNRVAALINELDKLGFVIEEPAEGMLAWKGETKAAQQPFPVIKTYDDHRMAMAFAPAALTQKLEIEHPEVVSKSYPDFWKDIENAGLGSRD